ncbi:hypothetical protein JCM12294_42140 [Desulfocicer niacini]
MTIDPALNKILYHLYETNNVDLSGYRQTMIQDHIYKRCDVTRCKDNYDYLIYLQNNTHEAHVLIDSLTINVSWFFRNPLTFEYIANHILPVLAHEKVTDKTLSLRIWSNGCAMGEEPYSMAILINELCENTQKKLDTTIFATDIDRTVLAKARQGIYEFESIKDVKYRLLKKFFSMQGNFFRLNAKIKERVFFSPYDILNKNSYAPPESVFGGFDMVLCRNLMIYFNAAYQEKICNKLHKSLTKNGYLILGEAERPAETYRKYFKKVNECCHIYQKIQ